MSDYGSGKLYSPDLSDVLLGNRLPSVVKEFIGRKNELKEIDTLLKQDFHIFITGMAGIGKVVFHQKNFLMNFLHLIMQAMSKEKTLTPAATSERSFPP